MAAAIVLCARTQRGTRVIAVSPGAQTQGVQPGMSDAEAISLLNGVAAEVHLHNPEEDREKLESLAIECQQFAPVVALDEQQPVAALLLDVTGCGPVFGGEAFLLQRVDDWAMAAGYVVRMGLADSTGTAWAVAHCQRDLSIRDAETYTGEKRPVTRRPVTDRSAKVQPVANRSVAARLAEYRRFILPPGDFAAIEELPLTVLRLEPTAVQLLHQLGLRTVRELLSLPRSELPARFGAHVLLRIDQAMGRQPEVLVPFLPPETISEQCEYEDPVSDLEFLSRTVCDLLQRVLVRLQQRGHGVLRLECVARLQPLTVDRNAESLISSDSRTSNFNERVDQGDRVSTENGSRAGAAALREGRCAVELSQPSLSVPHLCELWRIRWEKLEIRDAVSALRLTVAKSCLISGRQRRLDGGSTTQESAAEMTALVDRLTNRLSREVVLRPVMTLDPVPELGCEYRPAVLGMRESSGRTIRGDVANSKSDTAGSKQHKSLQKGGSQLHKTDAEPGVAPGADDTEAVSYGTIRPSRLTVEPRPINVLAVMPDGPPIRWRWGGEEHVAQRVWGPERIESGWWREATAYRDYYCVQTTAGRRYWLFRDRENDCWFMHGTF